MKQFRQITAALCAVLLLGACGAKQTPEETAAPEEPEKETAMVQNIETAHGTMNYLHFGNPEGPVFVILPGLSLKSVMGAAEAVTAAYADLAADNDMYLFDRIEEFPEGYDISAMAEDTCDAFDQLGLKDITVMGVSQGGMIAQTIALSRPELVSRLVLCSTAPSVKNIDQTVFEEWHALAENKDTAALAESFGKYVYTPDFFEQYKDPILASADGATDRDLQNFVISLEGTMSFDLSDRLSEITCPCFVLGAGEDRVLGVQGSYDLMEKLGCEGYIYEGKGHGVYDEAPDYRSRIMAFLAESGKD